MEINQNDDFEGAQKSQSNTLLPWPSSCAMMQYGRIVAISQIVRLIIIKLKINSSASTPSRRSALHPNPYPNSKAPLPWTNNKRSSVFCYQYLQPLNVFRSEIYFLPYNIKVHYVLKDGQRHRCTVCRRVLSYQTKERGIGGVKFLGFIVTLAELIYKYFSSQSHANPPRYE